MLSVKQYNGHDLWLSMYYILQYNSLFSLNYVDTKKLSNLCHKPSTPIKHNFNDDLELKNIMSKPYTSKQYNNYIFKDFIKLINIYKN